MGRTYPPGGAAGLKPRWAMVFRPSGDRTANDGSDAAGCASRTANPYSGPIWDAGGNWTAFQQKAALVLMRISSPPPACPSRRKDSHPAYRAFCQMQPCVLGPGMAACATNANAVRIVWLCSQRVDDRGPRRNGRHCVEDSGLWDHA